jgi:hypothetical protein
MGEVMRSRKAGALNATILRKAMRILTGRRFMNTCGFVQDIMGIFEIQVDGVLSSFLQ